MGGLQEETRMLEARERGLEGRAAEVPEVRAAEARAKSAHAGQKDRGGADYIGHPRRVASRLAGHPRAQVLAFLHDVLEDTPVTPGELEGEFGSDVAGALLNLTRNSGEDYFAYIRRAAADRDTRWVKMSDLLDNMDASRLGHEPSPTEQSRLFKYRLAMGMLLDACEAEGPSGFPPFANLARKAAGR